MGHPKSPQEANYSEGSQSHGSPPVAVPRHWMSTFRGLDGNEVGAASVSKSETGLNGTVAYGALRVRREGHLAAKAGVAAKQNAAAFAQGDVTPFATETDRHLAERSGASESAFELECAGVLRRRCRCVLGGR